MLILPPLESERKCEVYLANADQHKHQELSGGVLVHAFCYQIPEGT